METKHCPSCAGSLYYRSSSDSYRCRKCGETWGQLAIAVHEQETARHAISKQGVRNALANAQGDK